jgi:DNA polymerase-3 subunit gamma/tau
LQNAFKNPSRVGEKKKEEPIEVERITDTPVITEELGHVLEEFAKLRKNQLAEYHLLTRNFSFKDNVVSLPLSNPIEEPLLQGIKTQLTAYLRDKLNNSSITVTGILQEIERKVVYTNKEKFDHLAEKNPMLKELKERLGLDPDF